MLLASELSEQDIIQIRAAASGLQDVEVDFRLSVLKPLHAQWLVNMYNFFSERGRVIISKGWKKAGIAGVLDGTTACHQMTHLNVLIIN